MKIVVQTGDLMLYDSLEGKNAVNDKQQRFMAQTRHWNKIRIFVQCIYNTFNSQPCFGC